MAFELTDDGTLDTVLRCSLCGEECRYNFDGEGEQTYDEFVDWAIEDAEAEHECAQTYEVVVGNIGTVYSGASHDEAVRTFKEYKDQSERGYGRASGEPVTLLKGDEIVYEHDGTLEA